MYYQTWEWGREVSAEVCESIIAAHKHLVSDAVIYSPVGDKIAETTNKKIRRSKVTFDVAEDAKSLLYGFVVTANRMAFGVDLANYSQFQFTMYEGSDEGMYDWHIDSLAGSGETAFDRKLTAILMLSSSDDYEGGELVIGTGGTPKKMNQGDVVVFPSFTAHKVFPVVSGVRHSLVCWAEGPHWR